MQNNIMKTIYFLALFVICCSISGCFLFGVKGIFEGNNYQIIKLEIANRVILSPQELSSKAKEQMTYNPNVNVSYADIKPQLGRIDDLNASFEQLKQTNRDDDSDDSSTPVKVLANINLKSTFQLDRTKNTIYGMAGCNDYTAKFFWQDATKIVISGTASTKKSCTPKEVANFQDTLIRNLDGIYVITKLRNRKGYVLNNGRMRIYIR